MNYIKRYYALILSALVIIPCSETKNMDRSWSNSNKALLLIGITFVGGYCLFRFCRWLKPVEELKKTSSQIQDSSIVTDGDVAGQDDYSAKKPMPDNNCENIIKRVPLENVYFDEIIIRGLGEVHIMQVNSDKDEYASIIAPSNIIEKLNLQLTEKCLEMGTKENEAITFSTRPVYTIALVSLTKLSLCGDLEAQFVTPIEMKESLKIMLHANAKLSCKNEDASINLSDLCLNACDNSQAQLHGIALQQKIILSNAAQYEASGLRSHTIKLTGSSTSKAKVALEDYKSELYGTIRASLQLTLSDNSEVTYGGNPAITSDVTGGASFLSSGFYDDLIM